ncbi:hypothetical protein AVEN_156034-1, partial [Araneus ventricosus]
SGMHGFNMTVRLRTKHHEAVPGGGIRGTNNRVWWFQRVASTFT